MSDDWDDDAPPADEPPADEEDENQDRGESLRGLVTDFEPPKGNAPAKFKIAGQRAQVWPYEYGDEERTEHSDTYKAIKRAAIDDGAVEASGEYKKNSFFSKKAGKQITTTVFSVWEAGEIEVTSEMKTAAEVAKTAPKKGGQGKGQSKGGGYKGLSQEEWDEKNRRDSAKIRSAWAVQTAVQVLVTAGTTSENAPTLEKIEEVSIALVQIAGRVEHYLLSGSDSATATPPQTSAEEPSSAPASKGSAPSKASKKPAKS